MISRMKSIIFIQDNMCKNKNRIINYMPRKMTKLLRSKTAKSTNKSTKRTTKRTTKIGSKKSKKQATKKYGKSRKVILTKGKYSFKRTRKQKGGSYLPETDLMLQNISEKIASTQNTIDGAHVSVSGKDWIQPELTKY